MNIIDGKEQKETISKVTLTDEQIETLRTTLAETDPEPIVCPESYDEEDATPVEVLANIDPATGNITNISNKPDVIDALNDAETEEDITKILDSIEAADVSADEIDIDKVVKDKYKLDLSDEDILLLKKAVTDFEAGEKITYNDMPTSVKREISRSIIELSDKKNALYVGNTELKNQMAREFISTLYSEGITNVFESTMLNLQTSIDNYSKKAISDLYNDKFSKQREVLENETLRIADEIEAEKPEDAKMLREVAEAFHDSYTYEKMFEECKATGKLKVKKIDIEKKKRVFAGFDYKYSKTKNVIKSVTLIEPILRRHLPPKISDESITKFVIIFCKYAANMDPNKITDHIFMYYFISNITGLDILTHEGDDSSFYDEIVSNITKFIDKITYKK